MEIKIGDSITINVNVPDVYEDGLKSATIETGKTIKIIPETINAVLAPLRQWIARREYNVEETKKLLEIKLENINAESIVTPDPYVAVPAFQAISYSMDSEDLRNLYANLLATSMINETKWKVHPSFVEIIKQITPDEAKLLKTLSEKGDIYPSIGIILKDNNSHISHVYHFTNLANNVCENPNGIFSYLDNLERLKLIEIPFGESLNDESYQPFEDDPYVKELMSETIHENYKWEIENKYFRLTQYGKDFIEVCVKDD